MVGAAPDSASSAGAAARTSSETAAASAHAAAGSAAGHVVAYDRGGAVSVVTRLPVGLAAAGGWGDTTLDLPDGQWHDVLTGLDTDGRLAELLGVHPVALLVRKD